MKKNLMMRIAAVLMVCVLATTCGISGTFAKYVTSAETSDTARVAKWGVMLSVSGDGIFSEEYEEGNKTVISSNTEKLVAPGTKNETGITFTLKGQPEVAFKVTVGLGTFQDVVLKAGNNYPDYTQTPAGTFSLDKDYNPVVFTLKHTYANGAQSIAGAAALAGVTCDTSVAGLDVITGTLEQINAVLAKLTDLMAEVGPNYILDDGFELTWAWAFEQTDAELYNKADTLLGNLAAGTATGVAGDAYNLWLEYNFSITIEQVD